MEVLVFKDIKNKRWTLWSLDRKTHIGYRKTLSLRDCSLIVIEEKRKQVLKTKKRFPHAWITGTLCPIKKQIVPITYNPFTDDSFMVGKIKAKKSKEVFFSSSGKTFTK